MIDYICIAPENYRCPSNEYEEPDCDNCRYSKPIPCEPLENQ